MDWTKISTDPNDSNAMRAVHEHLHSIRVVDDENVYIDWVVNRVRNRSCLDVGAVEHDMSYVEKDTWKHKKLIDSASKVVGVDIIEEYVNELNSRGYDIRLCDATSDKYIGEQFDVVVIGDVLEHVTNVQGLLDFSLRHLKEDGEIIVKTPNPHYRSFIKSFIKKKFYINLEHVAWYSPSQVLEIARRSGCTLESYRISYTEGKRWYWRFVNPELFSQDYVFIFTHKK
ncbi:MAG: class I SAM-dependent methyltransferase [Gammaproteobacteria bacterium]|nr:class I SAM-dependent methyltransferase [Gammaproteobacteria bacterium]